MTFLADMGVSLTTTSWLREQGYDVNHVRELGMNRAMDSEILDLALKEKRVILTFDLDFGDLLAASGDKLPSIIIFRLKNTRPNVVNKRLKQVLKHSISALQKGSIISVDEKTYRIRHLPIKKQS